MDPPLNLVGGAVLLSVLLVDGAMPGNSEHALDGIAQEIATKPISGTFARAVLAGTLLALLSYLLKAVDTATARILVAYLVGVFLALGPFDHVVVSALHLLFGVWHTGSVTYTDLAVNIAVSTAGNLVGGLGLITLTHTAQVKGK